MLDDQENEEISHTRKTRKKNLPKTLSDKELLSKLYKESSKLNNKNQIT